MILQTSGLALFLGAISFGIFIYLFFWDEHLLNFKRLLTGRKSLLIYFLFLIRIVSICFFTADNLAFMQLHEKTLALGYPLASGEPLFVSYWSEHNFLDMYVCHPPFIFYLYALPSLLLDPAYNLFTVLVFLSSVHVFWNWLEKRDRDPLIPCLLYGTFPLFYIESMTPISLNVVLISFLMVGIVRYLDYLENDRKKDLYKFVLAFSLVSLIEYTGALFIGFLCLHFAWKKGITSRVLIIVLVILSPFVLWNVFAGFPIFHSYAFTYTEKHHFDESLDFPSAVRDYYSYHKDAIVPYFFMDNVFFAFVGFLVFANFNVLLVDPRIRLRWMFLGIILLQLLLLTYYAVFAYQSHAVSNFVRYVIPSLFLVVPLSLRKSYDGKWFWLAIFVILLNICVDLSVIFTGFQWVSLKWVSCVVN